MSCVFAVGEVVWCVGGGLDVHEFFLLVGDALVDAVVAVEEVRGFDSVVVVAGVGALLFVGGQSLVGEQVGGWSDEVVGEGGLVVEAGCVVFGDGGGLGGFLDGLAGLAVVERVFTGAGLLLHQFLGLHLLSYAVLFLGLPAFPFDVFGVVVIVYHYPDRVFVLPRQHHFLGLHVFLGDCFLGFSQFLDSVGVAEGVEGVFRGCGGGRDVADHDSPAEADEGVLEDHGEFRSAEGGVSLALVQCADALLEGEEGLVDFCSVDPRLFVHVHVVCAPFVAGEVDERDFPVQFFAVLEGDLEDGV